eukprot:6244150-Heterocapsa_arctica.AAC.1
MLEENSLAAGEVRPRGIGIEEVQAVDDDQHIGIIDGRVEVQVHGKEQRKLDESLGTGGPKEGNGKRFSAQAKAKAK